MKYFYLFLCLCFFNRESFGQDTTGSGKAKPFVLGNIEEIDSKILSEKRTLNIYLPPGYNKNDTTRYPVIYLLDGSADEDFIHIAGLVQFANFPWVNLLPHSILVGIANVDRRRDFTFPTTIAKDKADFPTTGKSENFINFLEQELQPFIDSAYKTSLKRTIIGQSLGGLLATEVLYSRPYLFTHYIIISPSLWWDNGSLLKKQMKITRPSNTSFVFIGNGKEGKIMEADAKKLVAAVNRRYWGKAKVYYECFTNENHASILHNAVYKAFEVMNKPLKK